MSIDLKPRKKRTKVRSPKDIVRLIPDKPVADFVSTVLMAFDDVPNDGRPPWALVAAKEFLLSCFAFGRRKTTPAYEAASLIGLAKKEKKDFLKECPQFETLFADLEGVEKELQKASDAEIAEFYAGYTDIYSGKTDITLSAPGQVYLIFAVRWKEMIECRNTEEVRKILEKYLGGNLTGSRERITKICKKIGFPLKDRGGRPRKLKTS